MRVMGIMGNNGELGRLGSLKRLVSLRIIPKFPKFPKFPTLPNLPFFTFHLSKKSQFLESPSLEGRDCLANIENGFSYLYKKPPRRDLFSGVLS